MKNTSVGLVVVSLMLSILIGLSLSRSDHEENGTGDVDKKLLIGLSMDTLKEARWQKDRDIFVRRAEELGAEVKVLSANSDDTAQMKDVNSLISNHVDVIVIIPHDGAAMAKAVTSAHQANIPVIAYDRLITNSDLDLYITFDNVRVGEEQARYMLNHLPTPGKGKIVRIYGAPTDNNAKLFKKGQDNVLNPLIAKGDIQVLHEDWAVDWQPQNAKKIINAAITNHGSDFDAILASNDGTAGGAIQALKEEGKAGKILVTGQDAELAACQRIVDGTQAMTIYKPIKDLASTAAELAVKLAKKSALVSSEAQVYSGETIAISTTINNGSKEVPSVLLKIVPVDRNNIVENVVVDGFHPFEEIYRNVPQNQRPAKP